MGTKKGFNGTFMPTNTILPTLALCNTFRSYSNFLFRIIMIFKKTTEYFYMEDIKPMKAGVFGFFFVFLQETKKSKKVKSKMGNPSAFQTVCTYPVMLLTESRGSL